MLSSPSVALALRKESLTRALPPCSLPMHTTGDADMFIGEEGTEDSLSRRPAGAWGDGSPCTCGLDCVPCELHCGLASLACEPEKALACRQRKTHHRWRRRVPMPLQDKKTLHSST